MCLICVGIQSNKLTPEEGFRNFYEMYETMDKKHRDEVLITLYEAYDKIYPLGGAQLKFFPEHDPFCID